MHIPVYILEYINHLKEELSNLNMKKQVQLKTDPFERERTIRLERIYPRYEEIQKTAEKMRSEGEYMGVGKNFAWLCKQENADRTRQIRGGKRRFDAILSLLESLTKGELISSVSRAESIALARSLADVRSKCLRGERPKTRKALYYLCAGVISAPYQGQEGYQGLGARVLDAILDCENPAILKNKVEDYLLK